MASYQFIIELLPDSWVRNNLYDVNQFYEDNMYDVSVTWKNHFYTNELDEMISSILPKAKSWSSDIFIWGENDKTDIQVSVNNLREIESLKIRIDLRENIEGNVNKILNLANNLNCSLFLPEKKTIINACSKHLYECINSSNANKFSNKPLEYLNNLANKESKN